MVEKVLIIKLGALGDVIRTLPLAKAIKEKYPKSHLTWITKKNAKPLFVKNPHVDQIFTINDYPNGSYDLLYNFDIDTTATKIAIETNAENKYGFYSESNYPAAFNSGAEYYINTLFDDELKRENKKTYQEMMFEAAELPYDKQSCELYLTPYEEDFGKNIINKNNKKLIGIHIGASPRWPSKKWAKENIIEFIELAKQKAHDVLLFGGPDEIKEHEQLHNELREKGLDILKNKPTNTLREFISIVNMCDCVICSDSASMHISLALKKPTIGLFFCTTPHEVEDYGLLKKIVSPRLYEFFPEKSDQYNEELTKTISPYEVLDAIDSIYNKNTKVVNAIVKHPETQKFLVIKRSKGLHKNKWAFPGGIINKDESNEQALKRELYEETNLILHKIIKQVSEYNYPRQDNSITNGECFLVKTFNHDVEINNESKEFKWVSIEELQELDHIENLDEELLLTF